jgi:glucose-6-phosphate isomerase
MINLQKTSGLPIELTDDLHLKFNPPMKEFPMTIGRKFSEMQQVLMDPNISTPKEELYYVYRGLYLPDDESLIKTNNLTYDVTILPPRMLGQEFNKTLGHYHANLPGSSIAHPEMYEVLQGSVLIILQKMDPEFKNVISIYAVEAKTGDKVIYPPNYGHILINIGNDTLVMANWLSLDYKPLYKEVTDYHGLAYYVVKDDHKKYNFVKNPNYANVPDIKVTNIQEKVYANFGFKAGEPMYATGIKNPEKLEFLSKPQKYAVMLSTLTS